MDTAVLDGMRVHYNFTKKHSGIDGATPAEASLIEVDGKNRWKTIIQNASLNQISRQVHVDSIQRLELDHQE